MQSFFIENILGAYMQLISNFKKGFPILFCAIQFL